MVLVVGGASWERRVQSGLWEGEGTGEGTGELSWRVVVLMYEGWMGG